MAKKTTPPADAVAARSFKMSLPLFRDEGGRSTKAGEAAVTVTVTVDMRGLAKRLGAVAFHGRTGKSRLKGGLVTVEVSQTHDQALGKTDG
jgi:hypothetical protein